MSAYDDVTDRIHGPSGVAFRYGRDQARALSPMAPGTADFVLMNSDLVLLPENTGSPLYGYLRPGVEFTLTATLPEAGILSDPALVLPFTLPGVISRGPAGLFTGYVGDDFEVLPDIEDRKVRVSCTDALGKLQGLKVSTDVWQGLTSGQALGVLLDAIGWPTTKRDVDPGSSVFPWWWVSGGDAYDEAMKIVDSEGPTALLTVDSDGNMVFRGRHHRATRPASTTAQATWSGDLEPAMSPPVGYDHGWRDIVNDVTFDVPLYSSTGVPEQVWNAQDTIGIPAGQTVAVTASASGPFYGAITPVAGTDFTLDSGNVSVTLSRTSGTSVTISITALAGLAASVTGLQLRACALSSSVSVQVHAEDAGSIGSAENPRYGRRSWPDARQPVWASLPDVKGIAQMILGQRAERLPTLTVTFSGGVTARLVEQLTRDLSDLVHIDDGVSYTDADFFVEQISHQTDGVAHKTTFGCEKAPGQVADVFILGSATNGVLGQNRLGRRGIADPDTVFVLGSATNGVLGAGILAT